MQVSIQVRRLSPESGDAQPYWQEYTVEVEPSTTVLDALIQVREEQDDSLSLRCSCRSAICGSCAMRINGHAGLACKTKAELVAKGDSPTIIVEPMGNQPVIRDLVVDMASFWSKVQYIQPWLQNDGPEPEQEYRASNEAMIHLTGVMNCIMCGACVSDCTVLEVDKNFLGPAALAKAYRFIADPRDDKNYSRLGRYNQYGGIWDCTRCMECVQVCPKGVAPMDRIMTLREKAVEAGYWKSYGARHALVFEDLIERGGTLDEKWLPLRTWGLLNLPRLFSFSSVGLRAGYKMKMPPLVHHPPPGMENIRRIFEKVRQLQEK